MLVTFIISIFVLLMQFLWKYIDDLVGKGLEWYIIVKLMLYVSITLVPLALPLALLLASIMTFGNLAEHFELTAFKSAGVSLQRVMRPLVVTAVLINIIAENKRTYTNQYCRNNQGTHDSLQGNAGRFKSGEFKMFG